MCRKSLLGGVRIFRFDSECKIKSFKSVSMIKHKFPSHIFDRRLKKERLPNVRMKRSRKTLGLVSENVNTKLRITIAVCVLQLLSTKVKWGQMDLVV
jgi:hypothetical protein